MTVFEHKPHPRIAERKLSGPVKVTDQRLKGGGPISRLNARFGLFVTLAVGTMWCAYLFTLLALVSLPAALGTHNKLIIVAWIAQTFLQLILLPIIIVGQPRTGTTHLHNLLAADPGLRSLPYWESLQPVPWPAEVDIDPDPRLARCEFGVGFVNAAMPEFRPPSGRAAPLTISRRGVC